MGTSALVAHTYGENADSVWLLHINAEVALVAQLFP